MATVTSEQVQQMLDLLQQQVTSMNDLTVENTRLREANATQLDGTVPPVVARTLADNEQRRYNTKKADRPVIETDLDDQEWVLFLDTWDRYKGMIEIPITDTNAIRNELRAACSNEVNKLLFQYVGAAKLKDISETELLGNIKSVAVKVTHKEVHRVEFAKMTQNEGEKATHYVARLNAKAFLCKFELKCACDTVVSYAEERVSERLLAGMRNQEHQRKILSEAAALVTLEQKIARLQVLESTEESATILSNQIPPSAAHAARSASTYKNQKKARVNQDVSNDTGKCRWCGRITHGADKTMDRTHCPAREQKCNTCQKKGHFTAVCEKSRASAGETGNQENSDPGALGDIPSEASVSFSFAAPGVSPEELPKSQDFRLTRRPTKKR